jgi:tetratricopeptide (TPR) repeat protein
LGVALQDLNRPEEAVPQFERAIGIDPGFADAHRSIGIALQTMGRLDEARTHLEKALALAPRTGRHLRDLAESLEASEIEPFQARIEALLSDKTPLPAEDRIHLLAAMSSLQNRLGHYERAFQYAIEANTLARATHEYDEPSTFQAFRDVQKAFSPALLADKRDFGLESKLPIFIIGMPRSGSTLLEHILASHSKVHGAGEIDHLRSSVSALGRGPFGTPEFYNALPSMTNSEFTTAATSYLRRLGSLGSEPRVATKDLSNFYKVGLIHLMLPKAKFVHIVRDPIDTSVSRFMSVFHPGNAFAHNLAELGRYHRRYELLMDYWRSVLPAGIMLDVQYEDLVSNPEVEIRKLLAHCELEWEDACLDFHRTDRAVTTPTRRQVRQPAYLSSVGRWRRYRNFLEPLLEGLERDDEGRLVAVPTI